MGISYLWQILAANGIRGSHKLKKLSADFMKRYRRKLCIGIDASIYLYLALKNPKTIEELSMDYVLNHDISFYLHSYFEKLRLYLVGECQCEIQLVFDGASHPNKELTQQGRRQACEKAKVKPLYYYYYYYYYYYFYYYYYYYYYSVKTLVIH